MSVSIVYVRFTLDLECDVCGYAWMEEHVDNNYLSLTGADYDCPSCSDREYDDED